MLKYTLFALILSLSTLLLQSPATAQSATPPAQATQEVASLPTSIQSLLKSDELAKTHVAFTILDAQTGQILADYNGTDKLNPASNQKLLTTIAALDHLTPGYQVTTTLQGNVVNGVVKGGLVVRAAGDLSLTEADLYDLANQLRRRGIKEIDGGIIIDEGDLGAGLPPAFDQKNETAAYRASVSGFSIASNGIYITVNPATSPDTPPQVLVEPYSDRVKIVNQATTIPGRAWPKIDVVESPTNITITISGNSGQKSGPAYRKNRVDNPTTFAASVLKYALQSLGITVKGDLVIKKNPPTRDVLASHNSHPLATDLYLMNKFSNNFIAEMIFRRLGTLPSATKTYTNDAQTIPYTEKRSHDLYTHTLKNAKLNPSSIAVKNGSGLYDGNLLSTQDIAKLLFYASQQPWNAEFKASLPIAAQDGSLKNRFKNTPLAGKLYAKTGTLNEVSALSGYTTSPSGRPIILSILFNKTPKFAWLMRSQQDKLAELLINAF